MRDYTCTIVLSIILELIMILVVIKNTCLPSGKRKGFILVFIMVIQATALECLGVFFNNSVFPIQAHYLVKMFEQITAVAVPIVCSVEVFTNSSSKVKTLGLLHIVIFIGLELISLGTGFIFYVDELDNVYHHGSAYWLYIYFFLASTIFLFWSIVRFGIVYQNCNYSIVVSILLFLGYGIIIPFIFPDVKFTWLVIAISSVMFYIYHNDLVMYVDKLTNLLNQRSLINQKENIQADDKPAIIICFDVNNFKSINDNFGHSFGDTTLREIANCIKSVYSPFGKAYRAGGDEFCVILTKNLDLVCDLNKSFINAVEAKRSKYPNIPRVSYGFAYYDHNYLSIEDAFKQADEMMYDIKSNMKQNH